ncbi:uncharacterized protein PpBr36_11500 [Pyricularia pennisetigena]|uniref:uncharacterized protein n=1 Tax=Pyricularia pennisetigena TaxID=1578925 RepID=UPI001150BEAA|nr:uncharacterized protein PpBr36_11500 [Pyricularia pennisetigena]TLS20230.1 hypothetical protein PpBr36_11500 [Pyricularia pennisetigena]
MCPNAKCRNRHCFRRAALRAASAQTARTAIVSKRVVPFLAAVPATVARSAALPIARAFSVSRTLANLEENSDTSTLQQESTEEQHKQKLEPPNGIFVKNLVFDATDEHLSEAFSQYGKVVQATVARDPRGLSRGQVSLSWRTLLEKRHICFGFVYFEQPEEAQKACNEADNTFWHGRRIGVAPRVKKTKAEPNQSGGRDPTPHLFIGNIPYETTDADLNRLFQSLENLEDVRIAVDRSTGWPRGFAHADFKDVESAAKAVEHIKTMELMGRSLRVDYSSPPRFKTKNRSTQNNEDSRY